LAAQTQSSGKIDGKFNRRTLTPAEAREAVLERIRTRSGAEEVPLAEAIGRRLAEETRTTEPIPISDARDERLRRPILKTWRQLGRNDTVQQSRDQAGKPYDGRSLAEQASVRPLRESVGFVLFVRPRAAGDAGHLRRSRS